MIWTIAGFIIGGILGWVIRWHLEIRHIRRYAHRKVDEHMEEFDNSVGAMNIELFLDTMEECYMQAMKKRGLSDKEVENIKLEAHTIATCGVIKY